MTDQTLETVTYKIARVGYRQDTYSVEITKDAEWEGKGGYYCRVFKLGQPVSTEVAPLHAPRKIADFANKLLDEWYAAGH